MVFKVVVIDDEYSNRELLTQMISQHEGYEVIGQADGVETGLKLIKSAKPDAVFLDIRMPDGNAFELLSRLDKIEFCVVFVSAFDNYALRAFDFNALDYILKPIDNVKFLQTIMKLTETLRSRMIASGTVREMIAQFDLGSLLIRKISVHSGNKVVLLPVSEIIYARSDDGNTTFSSVSGQKYTSSKQLSDFDFILESYEPLVRINKGVFVNINYVVSYSKGNVCSVFMSDGSDFEVSRRKKAEILSLLARSAK